MKGHDCEDKIFTSHKSACVVLIRYSLTRQHFLIEQPGDTLSGPLTIVKERVGLVMRSNDWGFFKSPAWTCMVDSYPS